ncbi:signal peptidase II [Arcanobacterium bovis]|uniref:Lipoprotein signal peptidase n=1 Tax=Arcanobacterium bovis TaxID=2529275 RepID=A0A4Q9V2H9_9ACTO|nr:signal peptidase II [Arcanobacterium bovis]TBW22768.1 signal peptidase II [Arcanobacterium bovis]
MKKRISFWVLPLLVFAVIVLIDQVSKIWAVEQLADGHDVEILGSWLSLKLTYNSGAAFSLGNSATWIFTVFSALVAIAMPFILLKFPRRSQVIILSAIWAGAVGNLIDRLTREPGFGRGHVVDFINYNNWFIGNIADIALVIGVIAFVAIEALDPTQAPVEPADGHLSAEQAPIEPAAADNEENPTVEATSERN